MFIVMFYQLFFGYKFGELELPTTLVIIMVLISLFVFASVAISTLSLIKSLMDKSN